MSELTRTEIGLTREGGRKTYQFIKYAGVEHSFGLATEVEFLLMSAKCQLLVSLHRLYPPIYSSPEFLSKTHLVVPF